MYFGKFGEGGSLTSFLGEAQMALIRLCMAQYPLPLEYVSGDTYVAEKKIFFALFYLYSRL